jgi:hypothetical protein
LSGKSLLEAAKTYSELAEIIPQENEPKCAWYRALKEMTNVFEMGPFGYYQDESGKTGYSYSGHISNIGEVSANLCLLLHGRYPLPNKETVMSEITNQSNK